MNGGSWFMVVAMLFFLLALFFLLSHYGSSGGAHIPPRPLPRPTRKKPHLRMVPGRHIWECSIGGSHSYYAVSWRAAYSGWRNIRLQMASAGHFENGIIQWVR